MLDGAWPPYNWINTSMALTFGLTLEDRAISLIPYSWWGGNPDLSDRQEACMVLNMHMQITNVDENIIVVERKRKNGDDGSTKDFMTIDYTKNLFSVGTGS